MIAGLVFSAAILFYLLGVALVVLWKRLTSGLRIVVAWLLRWAKAALRWVLLSLLPTEDEATLHLGARPSDLADALSNGWARAGRPILVYVRRAGHHLPVLRHAEHLRRRLAGTPFYRIRGSHPSPGRRRVQRRRRRYLGRSYPAPVQSQAAYYIAPAFADGAAVFAAGVRVGRRVQARSGLLRAYAYQESRSSPRNSQVQH